MKHENGIEKKTQEFWKKIMSEKPILAFDFDGTLAPIVHVPNGAFPRPRTLELLTELQKYTDVAIVTGRSIKNLKQQLRLSKNVRPTFRPRFLIGNHGMEMPWDLRSQKLLIRARVWTRAWQSEIRRVLSQFPEITWIEFKQVSLTLHIKRGKENQASPQLKNWLKTHLTYDGKKIRNGKGVKLSPVRLRLLDGKNVLNVIPLDKQFAHLDKGIALHLLMKAERKHVAIYSGDDTTDEDVFIAKPLKGQRVIGVRVGKHSHSRARFYLKTQENMDDFLRMLIKCAPPLQSPRKQK